MFTMFCVFLCKCIQMVRRWFEKTRLVEDVGMKATKWYRKKLGIMSQSCGEHELFKLTCSCG